MRGKQSVRKGVWYIGGRRKRRKRKIVKRQRGKGFPTGLLASAAAPFLGEIAKHILIKKFSVVEKEDDETKHTVTTRSYASKGSIT